MTTLESPLFEQLRVINNVFANPIEPIPPDCSAIKQLSPLLLPLSPLKTELAPHQQSMVQAMVNHRIRMSQGYRTDNQLLHSKLGILGDPPGTGKTLSVLAYLTPEIQEELKPISHYELNSQSNRYFFSHTIEPVFDSSSINIIFVPGHLLSQWTREIQTHTRFQPVILENKRMLRNRTTATLLVNSPFLLTTTRLFRDVQEFCVNNSIRWNNVFLDEATASHIGSAELLPSVGFLWLITSNWMAFLFKNTYIQIGDLEMVRNRLHLSEECERWLDSTRDQNMIIGTHIESSNFVKHIIPWQHGLRSNLILRNATAAIPQRYTVNEVIIPCTQTFTLGTLPQLFLRNSFEGLVHKNIPALFHGLSMTPYTIEQLLQIYPEKAALLQLKQQDDCVFCIEPAQYPVVLPCCTSFFCGACIFRHFITQAHPKCPTCRTDIVLPNLLYVPNEPMNNQDPSMNKIDASIDYIQKNPGSYLIYSVFENNYYQLYPRLQSLGIQCELLDHYVSKFNKTIANFNNGTTRVLFVSGIDLIRGLTLSKASHLIYFSKCSSYEAQAVLQHSILRMGRGQEVLTIVKLVSSVE